jgi:DNA-binding transcriptional ArsR family regulator
MLGDPGCELSLTEISNLTGAPHPSVYREVQRAELAGLVTSRRVGNTRLVRADTASLYYAGLARRRVWLLPRDRHQLADAQARARH